MSKMKGVLNHFLQQLGATSDVAQMVTDQTKLIELPTRHVLLNQGEYPSDCFFLLEGVCHACYLTEEGRQYSKEFYWDQDVLLGFESLITDQPSPYLLETLSACQLLAIPMVLLQQWREQGNPLYIKLLERQLLYKEQKERFMLLHSPERRFQLFNDNFPELLERVADYQVASYLGITPISFSRIKNRLSEE